MAVAMSLLDASVETVKPDGAMRTIPIADFHRLPGTRRTSKPPRAGELITAVTLPPRGGTHIYRKVRDRASYAFALVSVAAVVQPDGSGAWRWAAWRTSRGASRPPMPACRGRASVAALAGRRQDQRGQRIQSAAGAAHAGLGAGRSEERLIR
jgi:xanthine dehydrogenase YagS FAD-binding subunit